MRSTKRNIRESKPNLCVAKVFDIDIVVVKSESGEMFVPIKPICTEIGLRPEAQYDKIYEDPLFSSKVSIIKAMGADGKRYKMVCLPFSLIYAWLFTVNPGNVNPEIAGSVLNYREKCGRVLFKCFDSFFKNNQG